MEDIANEDMIISITPLGGWTPGVPSYVKNLSIKTKVCSKKMVVGKITWTMAGCAMPPSIFVGGGGNMSPLALKVEEVPFSMKPIRKNDVGTCNGSFLFFGIPTLCSCTFTVTDAGQTKAKCN